MPAQTGIATQYVKALANPLRLGIVATLADRPCDAEALADHLEASEAVVKRHMRALERMGLVRVADSERRTYELAREPVFWEQAWDELPIPSRRSAAATMLTQMHAQAAAAVDAGGFDRPDMLLTRTTLPATAQRWGETSKLLAATLRRLGELSEASGADAAGDSHAQATVVLMLFTNGDQLAPDCEDPPQPFAEEEARERIYELVEELTESMAGLDPSPFGRVAAMAEELRLIARAAENLSTVTEPAPAE